MKTPDREKRFLPVAIALIVLAAIGYFAFRQIEKWHQKGVATAVAKEKSAAQAETDALKEKVIGLQEELHRQSGGLVPEDRLYEVFGEDAPLLSSGQKVNCEIVERQIRSFFHYLDSREYLKPYKLENGAAGLYRDMLRQLSATPPIVVGETRDLFTLFRNMAHLNRVLGKNRLKLARSVLNAEGDIIEPLMATFYEWFTQDDCGSSDLERPSLETLYDYAAFFLNTLGGRSYLFRRNAKVRILATYYSVLIIDRANARTLNPYGIDVSRSIDSLIYDLNNSTEFLQRKLYLSELQRLQYKYRPQKEARF